ncbi:MAG: hypothetical protein GF355_12395 [Candidatus Eisenbacteria bacterium]|nr:hypothetical protein [Candidatus Eisenbacteria bacterium]
MLLANSQTLRVLKRALCALCQSIQIHVISSRRRGSRNGNCDRVPPPPSVDTVFEDRGAVVRSLSEIFRQSAGPAQALGAGRRFLIRNLNTIGPVSSSRNRMGRMRFRPARSGLPPPVRAPPIQPGFSTERLHEDPGLDYPGTRCGSARRRRQEGAMAEARPKVLIPLAPGVEELEAVAAISILRRAGCEVVTATVGGESLTGRSGVALQADRDLSELRGETWDLIVIPGGGPGVARLRRDENLRRILERHVEARRETAAVCAGPLVLADLGLLKNRRAACHASVEESLGGARIVNLPVVEDGFITTSRGAGTAVEFALRLVRRLVGWEMEEEVRRQIHA